MTKAYPINSMMAALATAFIFTVSLSSANAGWGPNGQYGNAPGQTQSAPAQAPAQAGGYGGQSNPNFPDRNRPCVRCGTSYPAQSHGTVYVPTGPVTYNNGGGYNPDRGTVYVPPRRDTWSNGGGYGGSQSYNDRPNRGTVYVPTGSVTYNNGGGYNPNRGTAYVPPQRDTWSTGGGYGGSQPSSSNWNTSGGYGGRR